MAKAPIDYPRVKIGSAADGTAKDDTFTKMFFKSVSYPSVDGTVKELKMHISDLHGEYHYKDKKADLKENLVQLIEHRTLKNMQRVLKRKPRFGETYLTEMDFARQWFRAEHEETSPYCFCLPPPPAAPIATRRIRRIFEKVGKFDELARDLQQNRSKH